MIITKIAGGLGNQMFQYAIARHLAKKHNSAVKLDLRPYQTFKLFPYSLNNLQIEAQEATAEDFKKIGRILTSPRIGHICRKLKIYRFHRLIIEERPEFSEKNLKLPDNIYLDGYWESEKYFKDVRSILCQEFLPRPALTPSTQQFKEKIQNTNAVALHVRRGDRVNDLATQSIYGLIPVEYYNRAVKHIEEKIKDPHFFIFSDDPAWVREKIQISSSHTFVTDQAGRKDYEDLYLMSLCQHNIIANSTFSWWGAWLNPNQNKIVIAPFRWFNTKPDWSGHHPAGWIRI